MAYPTSEEEEEERPGLGGLLSSLAPMLRGFGATLLAQPSVTRGRRGTMEDIGVALLGGEQSMREAAKAAEENSYTREKMLESRTEREGLKKFGAWMEENPNATMDQRMDAVLKFTPAIAARGYASNIGNPLIGIQAQQAQQAFQTGDVERQAKALELEQSYGGIRQNWQQQHAALAAFDYLENTPGGENALKAAKLSELASSAIGLSDFTDAALRAGAGKFGIPPGELNNVLAAVFTINKATENIAANDQTAVAGQARTARGLGATPGTPLSVRKNAFLDMYEDTERLLGTNPNWKVPTPRRYEFQGPEPEPGVAGTSGEVVAQPVPEVNTPHPQQERVPLRTPPPPPVVQKTKTVPIAPIEPPGSPTAGQQMKTYLREPEGKRASKPGQYYVAPDPETGVMTVWQK